MVETLRSYSSERGHADWNPKLKNYEFLTEADYWNESYAPPAPVDPDAPTWQERNAVDYYGKDYSSRKMIYLTNFLINQEWGKSLYDIVILQTSPAVWNDVESYNDYPTFSRERCVISLLRVLCVICQRGINGQKNDAIVDSLETTRKALNYRQSSNKDAATYIKGLRDMLDTVMEMGGKLAFGTAALEQAIDKNIGNGMTVSQFLATNLNNAVAVANRTALEEACKQKILSRLLILNYKYKSIK